MDLRKAIVAMALFLFIAGASAAVTTTTVFPADGETIYPNQGGVDDIDFTFTVADTVATNGQHTATIKFWPTGSTDANTTVVADVNLGADICTDGTFSAVATTCIYKYTLPTGANAIGTNTYTLDVNVAAFASTGGATTANDNDITSMTIDNRFVDTSVEALMNIVPVLLAAIILVGIVLAYLGKLTPEVALMLAISAVIGIIAILVFSVVNGILTP